MTVDSPMPPTDDATWPRGYHFGRMVSTHVLSPRRLVFEARPGPLSLATLACPNYMLQMKSGVGSPRTNSDVQISLAPVSISSSSLGRPQGVPRSVESRSWSWVFPGVVFLWNMRRRTPSGGVQEASDWGANLAGLSQCGGAAALPQTGNLGTRKLIMVACVSNLIHHLCHQTKLKFLTTGSKYKAWPFCLDPSSYISTTITSLQMLNPSACRSHTTFFPPSGTRLWDIGSFPLGELTKRIKLN